MTNTWGQTYADEVARMRQHPGVWVLVAEASTRMAASSRQQKLKHGCLTAFRPASEFQSVTRGRAVWARFLGDLPDDGARPPRARNTTTTPTEENL